MVNQGFGDALAGITAGELKGALKGWVEQEDYDRHWNQ